MVRSSLIGYSAGGWLAKAAAHFFGKIGYHWLIAMGGYLNVLDEFTMTVTAAPMLFVRAMEPLPAEADGVPPDHPIWQHTVEFADAIVEVPGNHMSIMEQDNAEVVARAVDDWLNTTPQSHRHAA